MAHDGVKHDYHLVNPSPWPLVGSIAAVVMAMGGVIWMKGLFGLRQGHLVVFCARPRRRALHHGRLVDATW